jgi:hypothetical protein
MKVNVWRKLYVLVFRKHENVAVCGACADYENLNSVTVRIILFVCLFVAVHNIS